MPNLSAHIQNRAAKLKSLAAYGLIGALLVSPLLYSGCGFHLRGYDSQMSYAVGNTVLKIGNDANSLGLKLPLQARLHSVGIDVIDDINLEINNSDNLYTGSIEVNNLSFKRYELVGVLTEIRLVLSADVVYRTLMNTEGDQSKTGKPVIVKNNIQVERSYQFDEASVSIDDKQGEQIQDWLYESMAQRIVDQYVALSLPRVAPKAVPNSDSSSVLNQDPNSSSGNINDKGFIDSTPLSP